MPLVDLHGSAVASSNKSIVHLRFPFFGRILRDVLHTSALRSLDLKRGSKPAWPPKTIRVFGHVSAPTGLGQGVRGLVQALKIAGISVQVTDVKLGPAGMLEDVWSDSRDTGTYDACIVAIQPEWLPAFLKTYSVQLQAKYRIAYWTWETQEVPQLWQQAEKLFDVLWVPSQFVADAARASLSIPVRVIPHVVDAFSTASHRARFDLPNSTKIFLCALDMYSIFARKNPLAAIEAFRRAFSVSEDVLLLVKCQHPHADPHMFALLQRACDYKNIRLMTETLSPQEMRTLVASCDAVVSAHRAEGFGLLLLEAMAQGKAVIATGWSGNTDFMTPENSFLIDYTLRPSTVRHGPYPQRTLWAEVDIDAMADAMQQVHRGSIKNTSGIRDAYSPQAIADLIHCSW